jgi:NADH:ubiquinone oxidoreductase subunit F (NADH-binding)
MSVPGAPAAAARRPPPSRQELRLIPAGGPLDLAAHLDRYGLVPPGAADRLIGEVERSGLTGRGGGAFPAGRKLRTVAQAARRGGRGGAVVVANGSESEPASSKDTVLLRSAPHLVLDGIALAAATVGANRAYLCLGERAQTGERALREALAEREQAGMSHLPVELAATASGYLSGQETALIATLNGGPPLPTLVPPLPAERGAHRRPTLVMNVETLAHIALIGRYGARWFREVGSTDSTGSALVTVSGAVSRPGVYEIPLGVRLGDLLQRAGVPERPQAALTGGYFGAWLPLPDALGVGLSEEGLRPAGAALGPGVLAVLPESRCGLAETARITAFLASQTAGQCGPCTNGMPAMAEAMNWIAFGQPEADLVGWAHQLTRLVTGRGACHLPDGAAALVVSALAVFDADLRAHVAAGPCARAAAPPLLPIPRPARNEDRRLPADAPRRQPSRRQVARRLG